MTDKIVFEAGHFYMHEGGRRIRIAPEVATTELMGPTLVVEAYDAGGYEGMVRVAVEALAAEIVTCVVDCLLAPKAPKRVRLIPPKLRGEQE